MCKCIYMQPAMVVWMATDERQQVSMFKHNFLFILYKQPDIPVIKTNSLIVSTNTADIIQSLICQSAQMLLECSD